jgi:hypothetical protein
MISLPTPVAMPHPLYQSALDALPIDDSDYGSPRQVEAQNEFFAACEQDVPHAFGHDFESRNAKASTAELIQAGVAEWIGDYFAVGMLEELGTERLASVVLANTVDAVAGACHSHDHCDANMVMLLAFHELGVPSPLDHAEGTPDHDAACRLWNAAWDAAKARHFAHTVATRG